MYPAEIADIVACAKGVAIPQGSNGERKRNDENEVESAKDDASRTLFTPTEREILSRIPSIILPPPGQFWPQPRQPLQHGTGIYWASTDAEVPFNASQVGKCL